MSQWKSTEVRKRISDLKEKYETEAQDVEMVEARGVEPLSENAANRETTCLARLLLGRYPNVRSLR